MLRTEPEHEQPAAGTSAASPSVADAAWPVAAAEAGWTGALPVDTDKEEEEDDMFEGQGSKCHNNAAYTDYVPSHFSQFD